MTTKRGTRAVTTEEPKPETVNPPQIVIEPEPMVTIQNDSIVMTGTPVAPEAVDDGVRQIKPISWGNDGWTTDFSPRAVPADAEVEPVTGRILTETIQFDESDETEGEGDVEEADPKDSSAPGSVASSDSPTPDNQEPF